VNAIADVMPMRQPKRELAHLQEAGVIADVNGGGELAAPLQLKAGRSTRATTRMLIS
jgi:hypothetical protein